MPTHSQVILGIFFLIKTPSSGTITIYSAVIKPAFPAVVMLMPNCWKELATHKTTPQATPPIRELRRIAFCSSGEGRWSAGLSRSNRKITGISTRPPISVRTPL